MSFIANKIRQGAAGVGTGFDLEQSLRFNDDDSPYLSRTPSTNSNKKTWTLSFWVKRCNINGVRQIIFTETVGPCYLRFDPTDNFDFYVDNGSTNNRLTTSAKYRDSSAWYHIVCALDTTQATPSDRLNLYINGEKITDFSVETYPSLNTEYNINSTSAEHRFGKYSADYLDAYLAEVHFVDGTALTPTSFGETGDYGEWKPKEVTGLTYGTNGFYLPFNNDYTVEGFSTVTYAGNGSTQYIGGTGFQPDLCWIKRRNSTDWHQITDSVRGTNSQLFSNDASAQDNATDKITSFNTDGFNISTHTGVNASGGTYVAWSWDMGTSSPAHYVTANGDVTHATARSKMGSSSIEFDGANDYLSIPQNADWAFGDGDWTIEYWINLSSTGSMHHIGQESGSNYWRVKSTATAFEVQVEVGGVTQLNFPGSTGLTSTNTWYHLAIVKSGSTATLYLNGTSVGTGSWTGSMGEVATPLIIGNFKNAATGVNGFMDEIRISNTARYTSSFTPSTTVFADDSNTLLLIHSDTTDGSTTFTDSHGTPINTNGSITSRVKSNPTYGQSIVSYTGTGSSGYVGHGLSSAPEMIIVKDRDSAYRWNVGHDDIDTATAWNSYLQLNESAASSVASTVWGDEAPTSTKFKIGTNVTLNTNTNSYIAYCFHSVSGYSKIGSYSGNGSTTGPVVTTGFKPAFLMLKRTEGAGDWKIYDSVRDTNNERVTSLHANDSSSEGTGSAYKVDFDATGFQIKGSGTGINGSGETFIYAAFADKREAAFWLDQSGKNNDWTGNNLTESDISVDSPTNNFCTMNPLDNISNRTLAEGNLKSTGDATANKTSGISTYEFDSGKWYCEFLCTTNDEAIVGITYNRNTALSNYPGSPSASNSGYGFQGGDPNGSTGQSFINQTAATFGTQWGVNDIIGMAVDLDSGTKTVAFYVNGASQGSLTITDTGLFNIAVGAKTSAFVTNFGQDSSFAGNKVAQGKQDSNDIGDFYYTPPTGFLALCTKNLPDSAVIPSEHFNTMLYTNTTAVTGVGFAPDLVWHKSRNQAYHHYLYDSVRGTGAKGLNPDDTNGEGYYDGSGIVSFDADGVTYSSDAGLSQTQAVGWFWKAGGTAVSNTDGTITSSVSANVDAGFSIVSYTGNTIAGATIGHGLSAKPDLIWVKIRIDNYEGKLYNSTSGATKYLVLNSTAAEATYTPIWNDTEPTSSVFSVGADVTVGGYPIRDFIAYCFRSVDGYSKVGSYTGNGSSDGTFVYTGFRPAYVLFKRTNSAKSWGIIDSTRDPYNMAIQELSPNSSAQEYGNFAHDLTSNGFKLRGTGAAFNGSGDKYIYLAFAEIPFKNTTAR